MPRGVVTGAATPPTPTMSTGLPYLKPNPQLALPSSIRDPQFELERMGLVRDTQRAYADILEQLGFVDPSTGEVIKGAVELDALLQEQELAYQQQLAKEAVTGEAVRGGTLFSGRRATLQGQAEHPFVAAIGELRSQTGLTLNQLYQAALDLMGDFELQQALLIQEAAGRQVQSAIDAPAAPVDPSEIPSGVGGVSGTSVLPEVAAILGRIGNIPISPKGMFAKIGQQLPPNFQTDPAAAQQFFSGVSDYAQWLQQQIQAKQKKPSFNWQTFKQTPQWANWLGVRGYI